MRIPRFYLPTPYQPGAKVSLEKAQVHYALNVLRLKHNRPVELFDGQGVQAQAQLQIIDRRHAEVEIIAIDTINRESPLHTVLLQGISKGDRMDFTIQKATELGITTIQPLFTEHCDVKLSADKQLKRQQQWQDIAISACEQSNRNHLPTILPPIPFTDWLTSAEHTQGLVLEPSAALSLKQLPPPTNDPLAILIGPEGGLSEEEVALACQKGLQPLRLGPRILRTETAGLVILSALQTLWGDF
ncbi:16S rRNA (uracil(1498)-N(3))-methyltransferase [Hydrogenovibrio sp. SC-1]|uniref:16S rRNA (uracil(1498)-N(3))-methyltransferase n=1 Tax=Hydrogenovibrio sp. SC-1 TaxID=2065820 RepID=UPI000C79870D|nr:16S rRNA (uracil(1498)-N(3))-methyltransferase [Hydrogenovibrio sp. SC-1]PLA74845.1 16S rRNA (uracil(1498)-N(3))-methyltransferase [Hydrogenovibrio sp. SC-1]